MKSIFSGQMILFQGTKHELPLDEVSTKVSLLSVHNSISEFGFTVRKEIYNKGLRLSKVVCSGNVDSLFKNYSQVLDYGLLAMLSSLSGKEEEQVFFHQKFVTGMDAFRKSGFRYFLYGTIFWERERKQNLNSGILTYLTSQHSQQEHSDCLSCVSEQKLNPCNHACCQHLVSFNWVSILVSSAKVKMVILRQTFLSLEKKSCCHAEQDTSNQSIQHPRS